MNASTSYPVDPQRIAPHPRSPQDKVHGSSNPEDSLAGRTRVRGSRAPQDLRVPSYRGPFGPCTITRAQFYEGGYA